MMLPDLTPGWTVDPIQWAATTKESLEASGMSSVSRSARTIIQTMFARIEQLRIFSKIAF